MSSQWHKLRLPQKELPLLLFQYTWTRKGYELYVTDLAFIWSERLSREHIVRRAEETATTIDPSEGPEQLDVLLSKIGDALRADEGSATLNINRRAAADSLELTTSIKLPAPLKPLRWSLFLTKEPPSSLTGQLLLPLLKDEARWETDQRFLLGQIKQKDWVLGKLFDKLEAIGVDLGSVFPAAAGLRTTRKGSSRSEAAKFVKGIAPFDEQSWLAKTGKSSAGNLGLAANIAHATSESDGKLDLAELNPPRDQWWNDLATHPEPSFAQEGDSEDTAKDLRQASKDQATVHPDLDLDKDGDSTAESEDEEFQRQETPPRFKTRDIKPAVTLPMSKTKQKSPSPPPPAEETDQTTASEQEPEPALAPAPAPAPRRRTPSIPPEPKQAAPKTPPREPPKKPKGGLGVIGGKKKKEERPQRTPSPTSAPKAPKPTSETEQPHQPSPKTKRSTKLGTIGGKSKAKVPAHTETTPSTQEPATPSPKSARPPSTSEAAAGVTESSPKKEEPATELPSAPAGPEAAPETEKEKADRRREELKRQLEAKSNAPTKKKRRF